MIGYYIARAEVVEGNIVVSHGIVAAARNFFTFGTATPEEMIVSLVNGKKCRIYEFGNLPQDNIHRQGCRSLLLQDAEKLAKGERITKEIYFHEVTNHTQSNESQR